MTNGIRVSKPGYPVETATPPQLSFSSEYSTLRVEQQGSGTMTNSGGRTVTIPHNLGYTPVFICHGDFLRGDGLFDYFPIPGGQGGNFATGDPGFDVRSWADSTNIYIQADTNYGYVFAYATEENDMASKVADGGDLYIGFANMGELIIGTSAVHGALRFESLAVVQGTTIADAKAYYYIDNRYGSGDIRIRIQGIDQDNTAVFSSGDDPFNRTTTSEQVFKTIGSGATSGHDEWSVTSLINEIVNRAGWASGNALGIIAWDNNSDTNNEINTTSGQSYLKVLASDTLLNYKYTIFKDRIE